MSGEAPTPRVETYLATEMGWQLRGTDDHGNQVWERPNGELRIEPRGAGEPVFHKLVGHIPWSPSRPIEWPE